MTEQECIAKLQEIHELAVQNCPESAGAAWFAFLEEFRRLTIKYPTKPLEWLLSEAVETSDLS